MQIFLEGRVKVLCFEAEDATIKVTSTCCFSDSCMMAEELSPTLFLLHLRSFCTYMF